MDRMGSACCPAPVVFDEPYLVASAASPAPSGVGAISADVTAADGGISGFPIESSSIKVRLMQVREFAHDLSGCVRLSPRKDTISLPVGNYLHRLGSI